MNKDEIQKNNYFYITTTLPYINSDPHIGFAAEIIKADVIARYMSQQGKEVFFNTGTDEHGLKIFQKAQKAGMDTQAYCDLYAEKFRNLKQALNLSFDKFIRTTDKEHQLAAQKFWQICQEKGDIYKKQYQVKYCVGCELEKTDSDLDHGRCPLHPNQELELIDEENYFFRFSKYQDQLLDLYKNRDFVLPEGRLKEIESFVKSGLNDFSISRQKNKMPHGVPVPGDDSQVMYVWFDALVNYISTLGWPSDMENFTKYWPALQVCGKDNLRQQSAMWQAMLMSAGIAPSKQILVFGFLTINGEKISKSLGNTIDPFEFVEKFSSDALRYYLLAEIPPFSDGDYSEEKFKLRYNADLANGLGNLAARTANLLEKHDIEAGLRVNLQDERISQTVEKLKLAMNSYRFNDALSSIWEKIKQVNEELSDKAPWKMEDEDAIANVLLPIAQDILNLSYLLEPFIPSSASKIREQFRQVKIKKTEPLFPRIN